MKIIITKHKINTKHLFNHKLFYSLQNFKKIFISSLIYQIPSSNLSNPLSNKPQKFPQQKHQIQLKNFPNKNTRFNLKISFFFYLNLYFIYIISLLFCTLHQNLILNQPKILFLKTLLKFFYKQKN